MLRIALPLFALAGLTGFVGVNVLVGAPAALAKLLALFCLSLGVAHVIIKRSIASA